MSARALHFTRCFLVSACLLGVLAAPLPPSEEAQLFFALGLAALVALGVDAMEDLAHERREEE